VHVLAVVAVVLRITVWPSGLDGPSHAWTLRCGPVGGTLPSAAAACRRLTAATGDPFAPTPPETACTAIYGGPQVARVVGHSYRNRKVWATFRRRDGCETERWNRISFLLR
jgi:Subtilisin inhibitor-like